MLAATTAAGLPSFEPSSSKSTKSGLKILPPTTGPSSSEIEAYNNTFNAATPTSTPPLSPSTSFSDSTTPPTSPEPSISTLPSVKVSTPKLPSAPVPRKAKAKPNGPATALFYLVWDELWRAWIRFIATTGISVMEPWERAFTMFVFASLIILAIMAVARIPALVSLTLARAGL